MADRSRSVQLALIVAVSLASCTSQSAPTTTSSGAVAKVPTAKTSQSLYENSPAKGWLAGPELVVKPGDANILSLTNDELCPLLDPLKVLGQLNLQGVVTAIEFTQSDSSSRCTANIARGTTEGFLSWGVGKSYPKLWGQVGTSEMGTTTAQVIDGHPARLFVDTEKQYADVTVDVKGIWFDVSARDLPITTTDGVLAFAKDFVPAISAVTPKAQSALNATVAKPLGLTAAQVCSLMSDEVLKSLANLRTYPETAEDTLPDSYRLSDDSVWCTRGHSLTRVTISSIKPYDWAGTKPNESGYTTPETFGATAGFRRRELDDNKEFFKTVATVPFRQYWLEVEVRFLSEGSTLDTVLRQEVLDVLARLNKLMA